MPSPPLLLRPWPCLRALTEQDCRRGLLLQPPTNKLVVLTAEPLEAPTRLLLSAATPPSALTSTAAGII